MVLMVRVDEAEPLDVSVMEFGDRFALTCCPDTVAESDTLPVKPLRLVKVMMDWAEPPPTRFREEGLVEMLKSPADVTVSETTLECDNAPLVADKVIE